MIKREELVDLINSHFERVHSVIGDNFKCATGELYESYATGITLPHSSYDMDSVVPELCGMLLATFLALRYTCAPIKPEGTPIAYWGDTHIPRRFLYWRRLPTLETIDDLSINKKVVTISCRACISRIWKEDEQLLSSNG